MNNAQLDKKVATLETNAELNKKLGKNKIK